jgi:hypothetical protein
MRKLRMAVVLPLVYFVISITIFGWRLAPTGGFSGRVRWWLAMNAPVLLFIDIVKRLATMGWLSPTNTWGGGGERTLYLIVLVGGLVVWFFLGRALDNLWRRRALDQTSIPIGRAILDLFLIACGILLIFHGLENILPQYQGQRHQLATVLNGLIILVWSLLMIVLPLFGLSKLFRRPTPVGGSTDGAPLTR